MSQTAMTKPTLLSPAARAVLDAADKAYWLWDAMCPADADAIAAAALRAAADQLTPYSVGDIPGAAFCRNKLLAIAAELVATTHPKPPSLAEQALKELTDWTDEKQGPGGEVFLCEGLSVIRIRRALERLQELENNG